MDNLPLKKISIPNAPLHPLYLAPGTMTTCLKHCNSPLVCLFLSNDAPTFLVIHTATRIIFQKWSWPFHPGSPTPYCWMKIYKAKHGLYPVPLPLDLVPCSLLFSTTFTWVFIMVSEFTVLLLLWGFCKYCLLYLERSSCPLIASLTPWRFQI